jgi:hypothetical protein
VTRPRKSVGGENLAEIQNCHVTGAITPDAKCNYFWYGTFDGKDELRRADGAYFILWDGASSSWIISPTEDDFTNCWKRTNPNIEGTYNPIGTHLGIATVTFGLH